MVKPQSCHNALGQIIGSPPRPYFNILLLLPWHEWNFLATAKHQNDIFLSTLRPWLTFCIIIQQLRRCQPLNLANKSNEVISQVHEEHIFRREEPDHRQLCDSRHRVWRLVAAGREGQVPQRSHLRLGRQHRPRGRAQERTVQGPHFTQR